MLGLPHEVVGGSGVTVVITVVVVYGVAAVMVCVTVLQSGKMSAVEVFSVRRGWEILHGDGSDGNLLEARTVSSTLGDRRLERHGTSDGTGTIIRNTSALLQDMA